MRIPLRKENLYRVIENSNFGAIIVYFPEDYANSAHHISNILSGLLTYGEPLPALRVYVSGVLTYELENGEVVKAAIFPKLPVDEYCVDSRQPITVYAGSISEYDCTNAS